MESLRTFRGEDLAPYRRYYQPNFVKQHVEELDVLVGNVRTAQFTPYASQYDLENYNDILPNTIPHVQVPDGHYLAIRCVRGPTTKWYARLVCGLSPRKYIAECFTPKAYLLTNPKSDGSSRGYLYTYNNYLTNDSGLACYYAYCMPSNDIEINHSEFVPSDPIEYYQISLFRTFKRDFIVDKEYAKIVKCETTKYSFQVPVFQQGDYCDDVVEELYDIFEKVWNENIRADPKSITKFSGHSIGDMVIDRHNACYMGMKRKDIDIEEYLPKVIEHGFYPFVSCIPKYGSSITSGKVRKIFPMHLSYEAILRFYFRDAKSLSSKTPPERNCSYSYDIKHCDVTMLPYFVRYLKKHSPNLIPYYIDSSMVPKLLTQFPSGIYGTDIVVSWFTRALCVYLSADSYYQQGDGFLSHNEVTSDFIRRNQPGTINGFDYRSEVPVFLNWRKILEPKLLRPRLHGKMRYALTASVYKLFYRFNLDQIPRIDYQFEGKHYSEWDLDTLYSFCATYQCTDVLPIYSPFMEIEYFNARYSNWDCAICVGVNEVPCRLKPKLF